MGANIDTKYDAVIIGAGIGGLVCGCYLAKGGMKVLIVEKNDKPGGYCTSIEKDGFKFNLGITSFGNYGKKSKLRQIFDELEVSDRLNFEKIEPANVILTPDFKVEIGCNIEYIKEQLRTIFQKEGKNISNFFDYVVNSSMMRLYIDLKDETFAEFLDRSFENDRLKSIFCVFLGSLGLPSNEIAAISATVVFKEFILKGGNFLKDEFVDKIPLALSEELFKNGGRLVLSKKVENICISGNVAEGIKIDGDNIKADIVISNCDPSYSYNNLVDRSANTNLSNSSHVAGSACVLYMTVKKDKMAAFKQPNIWLCRNYNIQNDIPSAFNKNSHFYRRNCLFIGIQSRYNKKAYPDDRDGVFVIVNAEYRNEIFWNEEVKYLEDFTTSTIGKYLNFKKSDILSLSCVSPIDLSKLTNNLTGSIRGWASVRKQNSRRFFSAKSTIDNLYFTGQWVTSDYVQGGIVMAAVNGKKLAMSLLKSAKGRVVTCK